LDFKAQGMHTRACLASFMTFLYLVTRVWWHVWILGWWRWDNLGWWTWDYLVVVGEEIGVAGKILQLVQTDSTVFGTINHAQLASPRSKC
jgi:hypothetical protein